MVVYISYLYFAGHIWSSVSDRWYFIVGIRSSIFNCWCLIVDISALIFHRWYLLLILDQWFLVVDTLRSIFCSTTLIGNFYHLHLMTCIFSLFFGCCCLLLFLAFAQFLKIRGIWTFYVWYTCKILVLKKTVRIVSFVQPDLIDSTTLSERFGTWGT